MNLHPRLKWVPITFLALVLASILGFLYIKTRGYDSSRYYETVALLRQLKQLDAHWELDVFRSRMGIDTSYDSLVDPLDSLTQLWQQLQRIGADQPANDRGPLLRMSDAYHRAVEEKTRLIEHFKSHNAVLHNSLAFLPTAADDVEKSIIRNPTGGNLPAASLKVGVRRTLLNSLIYSQVPTEDQASDIQRDLTELSREAGEMPQPVRDSMDIFCAHVQTVLREQPAVNALLNSIAAVPTASHLDEFDSRIAEGQRDADSLMQKYRRDLLIFAAGLAGLLLYAAIKLIRSHAIIQRVNHELVAANESLEQRVQERTRQLRETQSELVATARQAGMAEIATNVLHNVGNVLNSVNVSANLISTRMRESKIPRLADAARLITDHSHDLAQFLTRDERGKNFPGYFDMIATALNAERTALVEEIQHLTKGVDHIRDIVAMQQSLAGAACLVEPVQVGDLLEDALRMNAASVARRQVTVSRDCSDVPTVLLDKHLILQILVNLIANALQAMDSVVDRAHELTLKAQARSGEEGPRLCIEVEDTGEGISSDNLPRLFTHGFTTRMSGHGFGLHSCALAARAMGGRIAAQSLGIGQGATFTLDLPLNAAPAPALANL